MAKITDKQYLEQWQKFRDNIAKSTPVDLNETPPEKLKRITRLEANSEDWFKYYFPSFYTASPAPFHIRASRRVLNNPEYYEVRSWSRELSKSGRTMFEVLYLVLLGKKSNVLLVSNTFSDAQRLLLPYKSILEVNDRVINDYGKQESIGSWEAGEFITKNNVAFRALGAGQSPRGTRNDAVRPDIILIDDIDTDEECRNPDRIKTKIKWIEEALIPTRSISNALLIIACGNIIAKYCCITEMGKKADTHEIINIRDKDNKSTWPSKNTEEHINRVLGMISANSAQKEYFNNPVIEGGTFKEITYGVVPKLNSCEIVIAYADPSTSNKDKGKNNQASFKSLIIVGFKGFQYFVYRVWLEQTGNSKFVDWIFEAESYLKFNQVDPVKIYIENNSLQDPFYKQVILPLLYQKALKEKLRDIPPITPDSRKKPDKFERIEGTLEPINRLGNLVFDKRLESEPNMVRMHDQMLGVSESSKVMDGPDALEGGVWLIKNRVAKREQEYRSAPRESRQF